MTTILEFPVLPADRGERVGRVGRSPGPVWIHRAWILFTVDETRAPDTVDTAVVRRAA